MRELTVLVKGAGEMATGIAHRLFVSGITRIVLTEIASPIAVRRGVAFSEAVYEGAKEVEGVRAKLITDHSQLDGVWKEEVIGIIVDPEWSMLAATKPDVVVDAIMAKRYTGTRKTEAPLVIAVGPGFAAPDDVHAVVESNRGHNLGRVIYQGQAEPFTGVPGATEGLRNERVLRSPMAGPVKHVKAIGDRVNKGDLVLYVGSKAVHAAISGIVRGLIREINVGANEKIGDIEPRDDLSTCYTISDKARAIAGGVFEAVMHRYNRI
jgi:xanthine dehydrogenase accessory factor